MEMFPHHPGKVPEAVYPAYSSFFTSLNYLPCFFSQSIKFSSVSYINSCAFVMFCIKH